MKLHDEASIIQTAMEKWKVRQLNRQKIRVEEVMCSPIFYTYNQPEVSFYFVVYLNRR